MPSEYQSGDESTYGGDTDLRLLHEGNDLEVRGLINGIGEIDRAQRLMKEECMGKDRRWVKRKMKRLLQNLGESNE